MPPKAKAKVGAKQRAAPERVASKVEAVDPSGQVSKNFSVWSSQAPSVKESPSTCYAKCLVLPGSTATTYKLRQIDPPGYEDREFEAPTTRLLNCNEETMNPMALRDIGLLNRQNTACVLDFLRVRFMQNMIYTTADPLMVAINPFRDIGNCTDEWIRKYRDAASVQHLPPHSFSIAREAMENLISVNKSQTIIVTGESGAGKTEATKHCMRYFASAKGSMDLRIQKAVMAANPVLEAFGNAKTLRNNNSSRFGRFMQLVLAPHGGILNGRVTGFLLEKVRVCSQSTNERSYHVFYQLLKGASPDQKRKYALEDVKSYRNLNGSAVGTASGCYSVDGIDDVADWEEVQQSLVSMQLTSEDIDNVFSIVSGVLKLGNVQFDGETIDGQDNAAKLDSANYELLREACSLLKLDDVEKVATGLCTTVKTIGNEQVTVRIQKPEAALLCQSLGKAMYDYLFKWIITRLNRTIEPEDGFREFMGMLDIFGFEIFDKNSLEQLLINITNEFLQKNFIDIVFERESKLYRDEGVSTAELVFTDNKEVIETLIGKRDSVFAVLEDSCINKGGNDASFYSLLCQTLGTTRAFRKPQGGDRDLIFTVGHTIADINYCAQNFVSKNSDLLKAELTEVAQDSSSSIVAEMFAGIPVERGKLAKGQLIASQFLKQLDEMMGIILSTEPHFIRCVKPNETKKPLDWDAQKVLNQLFSLSILEALQLKKLGFSWRRPFNEFVAQFRYINLDIDSAMKAATTPARQREVAQQLLTACSKLVEPFNEGKQWQIGKTMVFLKPEVVQELMLLQRRLMEQYSPSVTFLDALIKAKYLRRTALQNAKRGTRLQALIRKRLTQAGKPTCTVLQIDPRQPVIMG
uniref:Myosin B n=1 Tax=Gregarina polymorpha TaxID=198477 RepID=Q6TY04_GREPO|nr:myosin B [Gregarina polymorpha]